MLEILCQETGMGRSWGKKLEKFPSTLFPIKKKITNEQPVVNIAILRNN